MGHFGKKGKGVAIDETFTAFSEKETGQKSQPAAKMLHKERGKGGQGMKSMTDAIVFGRFMISGMWFCILLLVHLWYRPGCS